jgi:hypothetical protein
MKEEGSYVENSDRCYVRDEKDKGNHADDATSTNEPKKDEMGSRMQMTLALNE